MIRRVATENEKKRMELFRRVNDGLENEMVANFLFHIKDYRQIDHMLAWLIKNNITGKNLLAWMRWEHKNSILRTATDIVRCIEGDVDKKILVGRDYIPTHPTVGDKS